MPTPAPVSPALPAPGADRDSAPAALLRPKPVTPPPTRTGLVVDVVMVLALLVDLGLLLADLLWGAGASGRLWRDVSPGTHAAFGAYIHPNVGTWDLWFVALFAAEFVGHWAVAIARKTWPRWYAYPVLRWYDLLGLIPLAGFRVFRLLRLFSLVVRLKRMGWIHPETWAVVRLGRTVTDIVVEEISDRVVVQVLSGVQDELRVHGLMQGELLARVLAPRKQMLVDTLARHVEALVGQQYARHRPAIDAFLKEIVHRAVEQNRDLGRVEMVPMLGAFISRSIEHAIHDITANAVAEGVTRLTGPEAVAPDGWLRALLDGLLEEASKPAAAGALQGPGADALLAAVLDTLEVIKDKVAEKQWLKEKPRPAP